MSMTYDEDTRDWIFSLTRAQLEQDPRIELKEAAKRAREVVESIPKKENKERAGFTQEQS